MLILALFTPSRLILNPRLYPYRSILVLENLILVLVFRPAFIRDPAFIRTHALRPRRLLHVRPPGIPYVYVNSFVLID